MEVPQQGKAAEKIRCGGELCGREGLWLELCGNKILQR
jgi:hypothetical protein